MDPLNNFMLNNKIYTNNNNILLEVTSKLKGLISDLTDNKAYKIIIARIKDIINLVNNVINENKKNTDLIRKDIQTLNDNIISLSKGINNLNIGESKSKKGIKISKKGRYEGDLKNGKKEGKGIFYYIHIW